MKMNGFWGKRGLAVATSLVLCTSLIMPSFAASFNDLQYAIRGDMDKITDSTAFTVTGDDTNRTVTLNQNVTRGEGGETAGAVAVWSKEAPDGKLNVTIDLNGFTINGEGSRPESVFDVKKDSTLTIQDSKRFDEETGEYIEGKITGGTGAGVLVSNGTFNLEGGIIGSTIPGDDGTISGNNGAGVKVESGSTFNMNGGTISGNTNSGVRVNGGSFTMNSGTIKSNSINEDNAGGGGVYVNGGSFTMEGGAISGNTALKGSGGGVGVNGSGSSFTMNGGTISDNTVANQGGNGGGGGVWVKNGATFTMNANENPSKSPVITGNTVTEVNGKGNGGGVAIHQATFNMTGGEIYGNHSAYGTGVLINADGSKSNVDGTFNMTGGYVKGEDGKSCIYLEETAGKNSTFELSGQAIMAGTIFLGDGTEIHTKDVSQNKDAEGANEVSHELKGFTVNGSEGVKVTAEQTNGGHAVGADTVLGTVYDCTWDETLADNGNGKHSTHCTICGLSNPETTASHSYDSTWSDAGNGKHTHTCTAEGCDATESEVHSYGEWVVSEDGHSRTCTVCGATAPESGVHTYGEWSEAGNGHSHTCTVCGKTESADHNYGDWSDWADNEARTEQIRSRTCGSCGAVDTESQPVEPDPEETESPASSAAPAAPVTPPVTIDDGDVPLGEAPEEVELEEIEDEAVPLAGLFTRADAIGYLWEQAGSPEAELSDFADVPEDHQWAVAIGWAQDMGIAVADEDGNFLPDDLLLRSTEELWGEFQEFLNRYAVSAGIKLDDGELFIELDGEPDDIIMGEDAQVIFDDFFALLKEALAGIAA